MNVKYEIFGESHGPAIGVVLTGLPSGLTVDFEQISRDLNRRKASKGGLSTTRIEGDVPKILSGVYKGKTTGTPLCAVIENQNTRSEDYLKTEFLARPSHADYTGFVRYGGFNDPRGGGHFSGRLTAPLVFAGSIARTLLRERGIEIGAHILRLGPIKDTPFDPVRLSPGDFAPLWADAFSVIDPEAKEAMKELVLKARKDLDSIGGVIECGVTGLPAGIGEPGLDSVESVLSRYLFAVPAVKGVEFGDGFDFAEMMGSAANDPMRMEDGKVVSSSNHNGGILGGITSGMPVVFKTVFKPTASISRPQETVDLSKMEDAELVIQGRHDPCILSRASVVVEAAAALALCSLPGLS